MDLSSTGAHPGETVFRWLQLCLFSPLSDGMFPPFLSHRASCCSQRWCGWTLRGEVKSSIGLRVWHCRRRRRRKKGSLLPLQASKVWFIHPTLHDAFHPPWGCVHGQKKKN